MLMWLSANEQCLRWCHLNCESQFLLHPQLALDSHWVCALELCQIRMINDANYPWFLLIPQQNDLSEPHQLSADRQRQLSQESRILSLAIQHVFQPDKLNIASIGNVVAQLHVHHIARFKHDAAWPKPVWGYVDMSPYSDAQRQQRIAQMALHIQNTSK